jgi:hypothetical protein
MPLRVPRPPTAFVSRCSWPLVSGHATDHSACSMTSSVLGPSARGTVTTAMRPGAKSGWLGSASSGTRGRNGSPELLIVDAGDHHVEIPAGPKRALSKALRAYEAQPPLT